MSDMQTIPEKIDALTPEEKQHVVAYIQQLEKAIQSSPDKRIPALFPSIWISDDFDGELPDSLRLVEE